ncbi:FeoC-like transcriptional regulator [Thiospirillum jenense]|uniref:Sugar metabolism transcriptional regulator n=1 Tax=Thiospirillum jenense TaxID=1653858 RepID=A0A839H963_9GAMM|nr:FeoC-like transcriptional regulator [Thiospirillum jenense]MBB1125875.1 sugar metabolism transcriptional regulator [Thiospirillum jenense]
MLTNVRRYLQQRPFASLTEIARHLDVAPDVARGVCAVWLRRGNIATIANAATCSGCGKCSGCAPEAGEFYRWVE